MRKIFIILSLNFFAFSSKAQSWNELLKYSDPSSNEMSFYGRAVAISDNYAAVGAYAEEEDEQGNNPLMEAGAVYIYKRTSSLWSPVQKLVGFDRTAGDYFGHAVSMNNTTLAIGAQYNDNDADGNFKNNNIGAVYIYELDSNDEWVFSQKIVASDGEVGDIFGTAVFLHGNYLFVSSIYDDHTTPVSISNAGSVYVFEKINGVWTEIQKI